MLHCGHGNRSWIKPAKAKLDNELMKIICWLDVVLVATMYKLRSLLRLGLCCTIVNLHVWQTWYTLCIKCCPPPVTKIYYTFVITEILLVKPNKGKENLYTRTNILLFALFPRIITNKWKIITFESEQDSCYASIRISINYS